jgi:IS605 OrfB family transposase
MIFEKETPELKTEGREIGVDIGYKKLITTSDREKFDTGLEAIYEKISRKKQGSKAFKRALKERDNKINESVNLLPFDELKMIVAEDLKNVKHKSKGKIYKKFNNKLQRWSYLKVLDRLSLKCEERGTNFKKVNPAYTSQTCCSCGFRHRDNRKGEKFLCLKCGMEMDADYNSPINILHLGADVYSP